MTRVGYARVSSTGQDLGVQLDRLKACDKIFKEKRSGVDAGRPELKRCLEYLREGDTLLVSKIDTHRRRRKLVMGILALIAEFENDIRRERQMDGIAKARDRGLRFGRKSLLLPELVKDIRSLRKAGTTVPEIMRRTGLSKASVYRALAVSA